ncbi:DUF4246 family protein [Candidatus Bathyarchaeota archaeon]|nr:DUF4246 family protein [Candidatus Bathyarchaeota archaeon]
MSYPGLEYDLRFVNKHDRDRERKPAYPLGIHSDVHESTSGILLMREVAMMIAMDRLTDEPEWHKKVFDDEFMAEWISETLATPDTPIYDQIVAPCMKTSSVFPGRFSKDLLDKRCLDYVRYQP